MSGGTAARASRALRAYNAALLFGGLVALPAAAVVLAARPAWRAGLGERLGRVPPTHAGRRAIWFHGASVGEIAALGPVVRALRADWPEERLVVSSMTVGGRTAAVTRVPDADDRILFPLDVPWAVTRALDAVAPRLVLFSETELWPNFLAAVHARGIPAIMVSGRLSATAFVRYRRARRLVAETLATVRWFCVQTLASARRLVALGAPAERVVVTGSLKSVVPEDGTAPQLSLAALGVADVPVIVAASTHAPEEDAVVAAWQRACRASPDVRLVLAPRRPERFAEVAAMLTADGVPFVRRSALRAGWPAATPVLLLDTLGELAGLYAGARVAFVGGTLAPVGGHNLLEPAAHGAAVVFGPHVEKTEDAARRLAATGGGVQVDDAAGLAEVITALVADPARAQVRGEAARVVVRGGDGPLAVTLAVVRGTLGAGKRGS